jgi:hypothetical protein
MSEENFIFNEDGTKIIKCKDKSDHINIPFGVIAIGDNSFVPYAKMKTISFPSGLQSIGFEAFYNCKNLLSAEIPDGVTEIGKWAFAECSSLKTFTFSKNMTVIAAHFFQNCHSLKEFDIPNNIKIINNGAFWGCNKLELITLHEGLEEIGDYVFLNCPSLKKIEIPPSVKTIGQSVFSGCASLEELTIKGEPEYIGNLGLETCNITKINIYSKFIKFRILENNNINPELIVVDESMNKDDTKMLGSKLLNGDALDAPECNEMALKKDINLDR